MSADRPPSPEDDAARTNAARTIAIRVGLVGIPVAAIAVLCLLLGVPWWIVTGGILVFVAIIIFEA